MNLDSLSKLEAFYQWFPPSSDSMRSPEVSVVMSTYNHADFVKQAIESVLCQKGVDFEFLIADDGSTDRTREIVASINDERITFFPHEKNRGACAVINELIEHASGKFIALINSDDYWTTDKLVYQVQFMRDNLDIGACFGRVRFVDKSGISIDKSSLPFGRVFDQQNRSQGQWLRRFFDFGNCICHPTMLIRKSCYTELGMYNNRLRQLPDFDMWIRLVKRYQIYISDRELINFRVLPGENASSDTAPNSIRTMNEHLLIAENFFENITNFQLVEGFSDLLVFKDLPSDEHLEIEKAKLFFVENKLLEKPYKIVGLLNIYKILNDKKYRDLMLKSYGMDDLWFQQRMSEVDVLRRKKKKKFRVKTEINRFVNFFRGRKVFLSTLAIGAIITIYLLTT